RVLLGRMAAGQKSVVGIERGVQQIEPVQFLKQHRIEKESSGLGIARMLAVELIQALHGAGEVEQVEMVEGVLDLWIQIERIGMGRRRPDSGSSTQKQDQYQHQTCRAQPSEPSHSYPFSHFTIT